MTKHEALRRAAQSALAHETMMRDSLFRAESAGHPADELAAFRKLVEESHAYAEALLDILAEYPPTRGTT